MARYFVDTSALVKYYHPEVGSPRVIMISDDPGHLLFISRVGLVEIHSALARKVRTGELQGPAFQQAIRRFYADLHVSASSNSFIPHQCTSDKRSVF
ncbi:MAG TPA: type II toxin-antitoxin system VapC family toxin [Methylomirabilota bacterium]|nr:type II toxin-antitoxin system VapC family toxin [Methylomirabilota bacterium]